MSGYLSLEEDLALQGSSLLAQVLYLRGIRRFCDSSGWAGIKRRISRASLIECGHFVPDIGSTKKESRPSWDCVKSALRELVLVCLIKAHPNCKKHAKDGDIMQVFTYELHYNPVYSK